MKFYIKNITLWFKNNSEPRKIEFLNNKVNVITGEKSKGKSTLISIIDYCLLSSTSKIVEEVINENVLWYGLSFTIKDKDYIIIRKHPNQHVGSKEVYFSSVGEIPNEIKGNIDIKKLKVILENDFGIDEGLVIPYGGNKLKMGSKVSFRYFLLFNTLSENTIANANVFFDFEIHDRDKYVEALNRIFFLVIGIDDINNVLIKEQIQTLENDLDKISKKEKQIEKQKKLFKEKIIQLVSRAQEYDLVERKLFTYDEAYSILTKLVSEYISPNYSNNLKRVEELSREKRSVIRQMRNLERFNEEYEIYKKTLALEYDSLRPIEYINENISEVIPTVEVKVFLKTLTETLQKIKNEISKKKPFTVNAKAELARLTARVVEIDQLLLSLPTASKEFSNEIGKYIFIGELKSQLNFHLDNGDIISELPNEADIRQSLKELENIQKDTAERKRVILDFFEHSIQKYFDLTHSMGVYQGYKVFFDTNNKILKLRKADEMLPRTNIGSKSNHMFLHLCLFLGMHEHLIKETQPYIPQFLILDQPSQPYLENASLSPDTGLVDNDDDRETIKDAFSLLNTFMHSITQDYKNEFQIILLEHASKDYWESPLLDHFHLVEEFRNGNALIPNYATTPIIPLIDEDLPF